MNKIFGIVLVVVAVGMFVFGEYLAISNAKCVVSFTNVDGEYSVEVSKGGYLKKPEDPQKEGYKFAGWYQDEAKFDFNSKVNTDITLVAKWSDSDEETDESETTTLSTSLWDLLKNKIIKKWIWKNSFFFKEKYFKQVMFNIEEVILLENINV